MSTTDTQLAEISEKLDTIIALLGTLAAWHRPIVIPPFMRSKGYKEKPQGVFNIQPTTTGENQWDR